MNGFRQKQAASKKQIASNLEGKITTLYQILQQMNVNNGKDKEILQVKLQAIQAGFSSLMFNFDTLVKYLIQKKVIEDDWSVFVDESRKVFLQEIEEASDNELNIERVNRPSQLGDILHIKVKAKTLDGKEFQELCSDNINGVLGLENSPQLVNFPIPPISKSFTDILLNRSAGESIDSFKTKLPQYQDQEFDFNIEVVSIKQFKKSIDAQEVKTNS